MADTEFEPFRFLELPTELRLAVYESIVVRTMHHTMITLKPSHASAEHEQPRLTLVTYGLPIQLLATCRVINQEAKQFLVPKVDKVRSMAPRVILDTGAASLLGPGGLISFVASWLERLREDENADFRQWAIDETIAHPAASAVQLRFAHQAGHQLHAQWKQLNSDLNYPCTGSVQLLMVFRINISPWERFNRNIRHLSHRIALDIAKTAWDAAPRSVNSGLAWEMGPAPSSRAYPGDALERPHIISWRVPLAPEERSRVTHKSFDIFCSQFGLQYGWIEGEGLM